MYYDPGTTADIFVDRIVIVRRMETGTAALYADSVHVWMQERYPELERRARYDQTHWRDFEREELRVLCERLSWRPRATTHKIPPGLIDLCALPPSTAHPEPRLEPVGVWCGRRARRADRKHLPRRGRGPRRPKEASSGGPRRRRAVDAEPGARHNRRMDKLGTISVALSTGEHMHADLSKLAQLNYGESLSIEFERKPGTLLLRMTLCGPLPPIMIEVGDEIHKLPSSGLTSGELSNFVICGGVAHGARAIVIKRMPTMPRKADALVGYYDYGKDVTARSDQSFTVDFDGTSAEFKLDPHVVVRFTSEWEFSLHTRKYQRMAEAQLGGVPNRTVAVGLSTDEDPHKKTGIVNLHIKLAEQLNADLQGTIRRRLEERIADELKAASSSVYRDAIVGPVVGPVIARGEKRPLFIADDAIDGGHKYQVQVKCSKVGCGHMTVQPIGTIDPSKKTCGHRFEFDAVRGNLGALVCMNEDCGLVLDATAVRLALIRGGVLADPYAQRPNRLADDLQTTRDYNRELLVENAKLRRELEQLKRKPK